MNRSKRKTKTKRQPKEGLQAWYLDCLIALTAHLGHPPSCIELANWIGRTTTPVYRMLTRLETLGHVGRDDRGRFVAVRK